MENEKSFHQGFYRMVGMVEKLFANYEKEKKKKSKAEDNALVNEGEPPFPFSRECSSSSYYAYHSNEEINQSIPTKNVELRRLLQEAEEEKKILQFILQAIKEALVN